MLKSLESPYFDTISDINGFANSSIIKFKLYLDTLQLQFNHYLFKFMELSVQTIL